MAQSDIMVVDDNPANLKLLEYMLVEEGYEVRSFPRGRLALAAAITSPPDLILLDINMPEMNGYEVCERLKSTETLSDTPTGVGSPCFVNGGRGRWWREPARHPEVGLARRSRPRQRSHLESRCDMQCQACLANTAGPGEGEQAHLCTPQQRTDFGYFLLSANQRGERERECGGRSY